MNNKIHNLAIISGTYLLGVLTSIWYFSSHNIVNEQVTEINSSIETEQ
ncbi:hypothetical protein [Pseudoalteromonas sp. NBT06-2]|nr:hypothetical protein [Pseudoalteromonas sp. NBT06-2]